MPGIFGAISKNERQYDKAQLFPTEYTFNQKVSLIHDSNTCQFGFIERTLSKPWSDHFISADGVIAILHGHCIDPESGHMFNAEQLHKAAESKGDTIFKDLEGAYIFICYEPHKNRLRLINDRLAIIPTYWHRDETRFCFAPNLRFMPRDLYFGSPDPTSIIHFLSSGRYPGAHTPLSDISLLGPAMILSVALDTLQITSTRYWELEYQQEKNTSAETLVDDLGTAIEKSTKLFTEPQNRHGLFLSGGWDSRSILGASLAINRPPFKTITNGVSDQTIGSDTWLAKKISQEVNVPCLFSQRNPQAGKDRWLEGLFLSEVASEYSPFVFGIHNLPKNQFDGMDSILKGDVVWGGSGELTDNMSGVINKNLPFSLEGNVLSVLSPELRNEATELYLKAIEKELERCPNDHPADRQQWLWQMGAINRYVFALGYFDEEFIQVRRPLITKTVLDQWCRVPWQYRIHKNLFIETLYRRYRNLFNYGRNHTSHLANYYAIMAPHIRERTLECLHAGFDLDGLIDREECIRRIEGFNPHESQQSLPKFKSKIRDNLKDQYGWRWHRSSRYKENPIEQVHTGDDALVFRLYMLIEWFYRGRDYSSE